MSIERRLKRLEDRAPKTGFPLVDGSHFTYDPERYGIEMFLATMEATVADGAGRPRPPVPELLKAVAQAKDRRRALTQLYPLWRSTPPMTGYSLDILVETGEIVPVTTVQGYPAQQPWQDGTVNKVSRSPETDGYEEALERFNRRGTSTPASQEDE